MERAQDTADGDGRPTPLAVEADGGHQLYAQSLGRADAVLSDGRVEVDTNTVERSMRPIAMGRRNSLFSGSEGGAESWAIRHRW